MYKPARHSIKVLFPTEKDIDKVLEKEEAFKTKKTQNLGYHYHVNLAVPSSVQILMQPFQKHTLERT